MLEMAAANRPPGDGCQLIKSFHSDLSSLKAPATVAEEKNAAMRIPSSERLYQLYLAQASGSFGD